MKNLTRNLFLTTILTLSLSSVEIIAQLKTQFKTTTEKKSTSVTIYNENLGIVKEKHSVNLEKGINYVNLIEVATQIDPSSVNVDINANLLEQNYQYDLASMQSILQKFIDNEIILTGKTEIIGKLISISGNEIVIQTKDGGITMIPNINEYQLKVNKLPDNLKTKPTLEWKINSDKKSNEEINLTYKTGGMAWNAKYVGVLNADETKLNLNSWVDITNNSGASYKDAKLKLVAGNVNLVKDNIYQYDEVMMMKATMQRDAEQVNFAERTLMDYHIYELDRTSDILNNEKKQIALFNSNDIKVVKKYNYKANGNNQNGKATINVEFVNNKENGLGIPLPKGVFSIYKEDNNSNELVGEDRIEHTPKEEKISLKLGEAFDVTIEDITTNDKRLSDRLYETEYQVKINNRKESSINIDIKTYFNTNWELLESNFKYSNPTSSEIIFPIEVKANSTQILKYKLRRAF